MFGQWINGFYIVDYPAYEPRVNKNIFTLDEVYAITENTLQWLVSESKKLIKSDKSVKDVVNQFIQQL